MIKPRAVLLSPHAQYCPFKIDHIVYSDRNSGEFRSGFPCDTDQESGLESHHCLTQPINGKTLEPATCCLLFHYREPEPMYWQLPPVETNI